MLTFKSYRFGSISEFELGMLDVDRLQSKEAGSFSSLDDELHRPT